MTTPLTVADLRDLLTDALDRGLPPETAVVVDSPVGYLTLGYAGDPTTDEGYDMWFTLSEGDEADSRFTPGGMSS